MPLSAIRDFFKMEAAGGIVLVIAAALAVVVSNTELDGFYDWFLNIPVEIRVGTLQIAKPSLLWINDGLMAVFFFLVGLEIKREFLEGELSSVSQAMLPAVAAVGGMVTSTMLTLIVIPVVYTLFADLTDRRKRKKQKAAGEAGEPVSQADSGTGD